MKNAYIRRTIHDDALALAEMTAEIQQLHHQAAPNLFTEVTDDLSEFRAYVVAYMESGTGYLAEIEGQPVGCVLYRIQKVTGNAFLKPHERLHIDQMGVRLAFRGHGIGRQLMDQVLADAREQHTDFITLNVFGFNTKAIRFYEQFGFEGRNMTMQLLV